MKQVNFIILACGAYIVQIIRVFSSFSLTMPWESAHVQLAHTKQTYIDISKENRSSKKNGFLRIHMSAYITYINAGEEKENLYKM